MGRIGIIRACLRGILSCRYWQVKLNFGFKENYVQMSTEAHVSYEEAVYALNGLQSNAAYVREVRLRKSRKGSFNIEQTAKHLETLGIKSEDLNHLNIIHVSGTKGKGSTCAFTESILRHYGLKTGFYSSPHLISVTERIRIGGQPLKKEQFALHFWKVFNTLQSNLKNDESMPSYFLFLTVLAFYVFHIEKVDVAVIEVGIGGLYDCTNVITKPVVVGVSTLGLDHTSILGTSLDLIAEQKAGIFKPGVPVFTVPQPEGALKVLLEKAREVQCPIAIAPPLSYYSQNNFVNLGIPGSVQTLNASLALQLCYSWLTQKQHSGFRLPKTIDNVASRIGENILNIPMAHSFDLNEIFCKGLEYCVWPGRFCTVKKGNVTYYLDGAHTLQSIKHCVQWFDDVSRKECPDFNSVYRILLFNCTGERNAENLLDPLSELYFDLVIFTPNRISVMQDSSSDQSNFMVDPSEELQTCKANKEIWCHMMRSFLENDVSISSQVSSAQVFDAIQPNKYSHPENTMLFPSLGATMQWLMHEFPVGKFLKSNPAFSENATVCPSLKSHQSIQVLITGSLHLVGNVLSFIDPDLKSSTCKS